METEGVAGKSAFAVVGPRCAEPETKPILTPSHHVPSCGFL